MVRMFQLDTPYPAAVQTLGSHWRARDLAHCKEGPR
jgi:hypothetical protein